MEPILENNRQQIMALCRQHHVKTLYAFGSAVAGDFNADSDVDLLYEFDYTGFDFNNLKSAPFNPFLVFFDLKDALEKLFDRKGDLIPYQDFRNEYFKAEVEKTKQLIYYIQRN